MINKQMFIAKGTVCDNCADVIKEQAIKVRGVKSVEFNCADETGSVVYDSAKTDIDSILDSIEKKGYECSILDSRGGSGWIFAVIGMLVIAFFMFTLAQRFDFQLSQNMGYGLLLTKN